MRNPTSMLVGILVVLLVLGLPLVSAQPKSTRVSILSIEDPTYRDFTNLVDFQWVGGYDGYFRMSWSGGYIDLKPKFKYSNSNEYTVDAVKAMFPQLGFTNQIIKGNRWKWGINVTDIPSEVVNNVESIVFEVVDYSGIDTSEIRVEGTKVVYKEQYALDWNDVLGNGFTIDSITKTRIEIGNIQANIVGGVLYIDPMVQPYPYEDGYIDRDEFGIFDVFLTGNPMKVGNDVGATDRIYRIYMKFNTSNVEPWDTLLNATFHGRVPSESCGGGETGIWIQNITDYGDLGESDWDISHTNITIWYNTTTNSSGWHESRIDGAIVKGGMTYLRMQGTYELYGGVDCFVSVNTNESAYEPYVELWYEDGEAVTPPEVDIIYPDNHTIATGDDVAITVNVTDPNLDTILANVTFPNGTSVLLSGFDTSLPSDNFDTDTEGTNWIKGNVTEGTQVCNVDIDSTVANKLYIELNGSGGTETMHCGYNSLKRVDGDFDFNVTFNMTYMEDDTFFTLRTNSLDSFLASGVRAYAVIFKESGALEYRFGYNNGTETVSQVIGGVTDTEGMFRIKRNNTATSSTVYLYYWNNSMWNNVFGEIPLSDSARAQIIQFKAGSEPTNLGALNMTLDDFEIVSDPYEFVIFSETGTEGEYNVTIIANDTYGAVNNTESALFQSVITNHPPSRPFFVEPDDGDTVFGLYNIQWGLVVDQDGDSLKYNISLLHVNESFIEDIVTDYGCCVTTSYLWNTTQHPDGYYKLRITVYENETAEYLSTTETFAGTFRIRNTEYGNATLSSLSLYYSPYATPDAQQTIYAIVKIDGTNYDDAFVIITLDNMTEAMTWDSLSESYIVYWIPTVEGTYNFTVSATANNTLNAEGTVLVADPFCIEVHLWNNETMSAETEYKNEWAWVYATKVYDPSLRRLFGRDRITCPPQGDPECHWYGKYVNGEADVCLYEEGNYSFYIIGNNIRWEQNIGSGAVVENCSHCPPNVISKKFFYPLGNYYLDEDEILHLYISPMDRYVFGAFFGIGLSWIGVLFSAFIGVVCFIFALKWSGSIKTALAVLILLPTIVYIILHMALFVG